MPTKRIPLVGSPDVRGLSGNAALAVPEDQRFLNCTFSVVQNPVTGSAKLYVERRPGWGLDTLVENGSPATALIKPQSINATITAFGNTNSTIYYGLTSVGAITGRAIYMGETIISSTTYIVIKSSDGTGWYYVSGAKDQLSYTADGNNSTTITDIKVGGVNSTAGLYPGQKLTAASNIVGGSRIVSINSGAFTAVLDTATTGGAFNDLAITKEPIAKMNDSDFITTGTYISGFVEMDGYLFYSTDDGNIRNSDLNSVSSYTSTSFKAVDMSPDPPVAVARQRNIVYVFGTGSVQGFYNAGYATGSPLERSTQTFSRKGALSQQSIATLEDDIYFVGSSNYGDVQVHRMKGTEAPQKVSTPMVDKIIGTSASTNGTVYMSAFQMGGYPYAMASISMANDLTSDKLLLASGDFFLLEDSTDILLEGNAASTASFSRQMVYNAGLNLWAEWDSSLATFVIGQGAGGNNKIIAASRFDTSGNTYTIDPTSSGQLYQDNGTTFTMQIRTGKIDFGTDRRKFITAIRLIGDTQSAGTVTLEKSDDDFVTWETLGTFDLTSTWKSIPMCGSHEGGRAYRLTHAYNGPFRAEALEFDYELAQ
jgi:hypothetical protein